MKSLSKLNILILFLSTCIALTACNSGGSNTTPGGGNQPTTPLPPTYQQLYSFVGVTYKDGANPRALLIQGSDGNFYGTTEQGGSNYECAGGCGTVFKITLQGVRTTLYSFGRATDGANPYAGLIQDKDDNFYGTTYAGGDRGYGTVFKITTAGVETVLASFAGGTADGANPRAGLIQGSDGNFYGTTDSGGADNFGTVFKVTPGAVPAVTVLYSFTGGTDGAYPRSELIKAKDGNFYGTTNGDTDNYGTVFKITPAGVETPLYNFTGGNDGAYPNNGLIQASDGNFYGTTYKGGNDDGGIVFKITSSEVKKTLYSFGGGTDGVNPYNGLIQGSDGNFYGTTYYGGTAKGCPDNLTCGTIFKITSSGVKTTLYNFTGGTDGANPLGGLIQASDGNLYGTTQYGGGAGNFGIVFKLINNQ